MKRLLKETKKISTYKNIDILCGYYKSDNGRAYEVRLHPDLSERIEENFENRQSGEIPEKVIKNLFGEDVEFTLQKTEECEMKKEILVEKEVTETLPSPWKMGREGKPIIFLGELVVVSDSENSYWDDFPIPGKLVGKRFFCSEDGESLLVQSRSSAINRINNREDFFYQGNYKYTVKKR